MPLSTQYFSHIFHIHFEDCHIQEELSDRSVATKLTITDESLCESYKYK